MYDPLKTEEIRIKIIQGRKYSDRGSNRYNRHKEEIGIAAYRDRGIDRVRGDRESERVLQEREGERQQRYVSEPVRRKYSIS
jgi:hypothetical protein